MVKPSKKLKKTILIVGITGAVYLSFQYLLPLVIPFLVAYVIALALRPLATWLEQRLRFVIRGRRYGVPVGVIGGVLLLLLLTGCTVIFYVAGTRLIREARMFVTMLPLWVERLDLWLTQLCFQAERFLQLEQGCLVLLLRDMLAGLVTGIKDTAMPFLMGNSVLMVSWVVKFMVGTVILFVAVILSLQEMDQLKKRRNNSIFYREFALLSRRLVMAGNAYLKTQLTLIVITTLVCMLGLFIIGNPYYILAGIGIGLLDALPFFGTGSVLLPWSLILFVQGQWWRGLVLMSVYIGCYFLREFLEAKMMGDKIGLSPLETLMSMYVGLQLFGLLGFVLGPIGLLLIEDLVEEYERVNYPIDKNGGKG